MKSRIVIPHASARESVSGGAKTRPVVKVGTDFYILASSLASRRTTRVLANGQSFAVFDAGGDILESPLEALGFFTHDTRYLSRFEIKIAGKTPHFLNSYLSDDKAQFRVNLTNPDLGVRGDTIKLRRDLIQIERSWVLMDTALFHRLVVRNYAGAPVELPLELSLGADFADVFEVRGVKRKRRGELLKPELSRNSLRFVYEGLDGATRVTEIVFDGAPSNLDHAHADYMLELEPDESVGLEVRVTSGYERERGRPSRKSPANFHHALVARRTELAASQAKWARLSASNEMFDGLLRRSTADLSSIITHDGKCSFMMAGIPWFATLFGRDSLLTTMSVMSFNPDIAASTLKSLAHLQGNKLDDTRDEQPGKIVHEVREGEMAATGEVPFGRYYGSVDSTPLFLWLLGRYATETGDLAFAEELWPTVKRALEWIQRWGDRDGDGYVEYLRETPRGLANQGWKDSFDAISHANGELAKPPIALAEVQGYVYAAYCSIGELATRLGQPDLADSLATRAAALKQAFSRDFWLDEERTVALALDGDKRPCRVMASNAAHCLATGLLADDQAAALSERLLADDMFSGWGVRTLGTGERRYNPMSYHNGSVWPHDNGIAAMGLARYGNRAGALRILEGLFDASVHLGSGSLPELFCGFPREQRLGPVPYPVACHPQAWSAASVFMILQAVMGLRVMGFEKRVVVDAPIIPPWLESIRVEDLRVADGSVSFMLRRTPKGATLEELGRRGPVSIEVLK
ncbi:MAG: amylo-alpha-1,6-glucosidase [Candidatus Binataceae bacterium]